MFRTLLQPIGVCLTLIAACSSTEGFAANSTEARVKNPVSTSLVCVDTATNTGNVDANSSIAIQAPACDDGYTIVSGGCASSNPTAMFINEIDTNQYGFGCEFVSNSSAPETVSAYGHCCRVEVKINLP
jgi:hypothetical protein